MAKFCVECGISLPKRRVMNPNNLRDEFCSQDCALKERARYWHTAPTMYALYAEECSNILGIFNSIEALERSAAFITDIHKAANEDIGKLFYERWVVNYPMEIKERNYVKIKKL